MTRSLLALVVLVLTGCLTPVRSDPSVGELALSVHGQETVPIEGARVWLYTGDRPIDLGVTDASGFVTIKKDVLARHKHGVIVACAPYYFCGALPLDVPVGGIDVIRFDEMWMGLQTAFVK